MSPRAELLDLPDEILDTCLEDLLPPGIEGQQPQSVTSSWNYDKPRDLVRMTAVCTAIRRLAVPFVWRRLKVYVEGGESQIPWPDAHWILLYNNPDLAKHVRYFSLDVNTSQEEFIFDALEELLPAVRLMENLRAVTFLHNGHVQGYEPVPEIFAEIISKPRLHTLISNYAPPFEVPPLPSLLHLGCCNLVDNQWIQELIDLAPHLESLVILGVPMDPGTTPPDIPWENLRQIELDVEEGGWEFILDSFASWKETFPDENSPLEQVALRLSEPIQSPTQVERILTTFHGQNLNTLILYRIESFDSLLCGGLVATFPGLKNLHLFAEVWRVEMSFIAESLSKLPLLKLFCSDYRFAYPANQRTIRYKDLVDVLGKQCPALEYVKFSLKPATDWMFFIIQRDSIGQYHACAEERKKGRTPELFTSTSTWDARAYRRI